MHDQASVLIVTDVGVFGEALARVLEERADLRVRGVADSDSEALERVLQNTPDVVLLDPAMPRARQLARSLRRDRAPSKVVVLGLAEVETSAVDWATEGIHGFVTRENSLDQLVSVIRGVLEGRCLCSPTVAAALLRELAKRAHGRGRGERAPSLTQRQYEVGHLLAHGMSNKAIASELGITVSTVKNHVHNILRKLRLNRRGEVADWIRKRGVPRRPRRGESARANTERRR